MAALLQRPFEFDFRLRFGAFLLTTASVYAVAISLAASLDGLGADAASVAMGLTLDMAVVVPVLYWLLLVRGGAPRVSVLPVAILSLLAARWVLPAEYHQTANVLEMVAFPLEIGVVGYLFWCVARALREEGEHVDPVERMQAVSARLFGAGKVASIVAFEASVFYYALASWRQKAPTSRDSETFITHHQKALYSAAFFGILIAGVSELVGVHWLVSRWSEMASWILSAVSLYGLIWLVGDYRAILLRPSRVMDGRFQLRLGLRWQAGFALQDIESLQKLNAAEKGALTEKKKGTEDVMRATLIGEPSHLLELKEPVELVGPYGLRRSARRIALAIDQDRELEAALASAGDP